MSLHPAKTQFSLGICPVWSESSLSAWRKLGSLATHWAHSEDSDQTGQMPRLIWVFAWRTITLLVFSYRSSYIFLQLIILLLSDTIILFDDKKCSWDSKELYLVSLVCTAVLDFKPHHRKPVFAICEQQRRISACASAPSDQCHCNSLPR